jgi:hypothetical protein
MRSVNLIPHPVMPCSALQRISAHLRVFPMSAIEIKFSLDGEIDKLLIPAQSAPRRTDNLWLHTSFEAFIAAPGNDRYLEFNFAPSGEWAIYQFDSYRKGMKTLEAPAPIITATRSASNVVVNVIVDLSVFPDLKNRAELRLGLSAVIENNDGALSYWALAHPPGKPDFHHRDSFTIALKPLKNPT